MVQGRLDIVADAGKKTETRIAVMEQGQCFDVSGILECTPRIATAVAAEDVVVVQKISAEEFAFYFLENQEKVLQIMRHIGALLRQMDKDYARLSRAAQQNALDTVKRPSPLRAALLRLVLVVSEKFRILKRNFLLSIRKTQDTIEKTNFLSKE